MTMTADAGAFLALFAENGVRCRGVKTTKDRRQLFVYVTPDDFEARGEIRGLLRCMGWQFRRENKPEGFERLPCLEFEPIPQEPNRFLNHHEV